MDTINQYYQYIQTLLKAQARLVWYTRISAETVFDIESDLAIY